jgi:hypothetical protein
MPPAMIKIPDLWLKRARDLTLHYAHTSHGSQIISGIENLESLHPEFAVSVRESTSEVLPPVEDPPALRIYDGNPPETYIMPEDYWDGNSGLNRTRAVADTGHYGFSMWSWCGQVSDASDDYIQSYLTAMATLESEYPGMRFIYMTGHLDGTGSSGNLHQRNEQIRSYCTANNKVLYDFADIERYDPDGKDYLGLMANDNCDYTGGNWAVAWCAAHSGSELCDSCDCAHSKPLNCNLKAGAFWWMMARLAGWDGLQTTGVRMVAGDFDGNGASDLAGLNELGSPYCTTDLAGWTQMPRNLSSLATGDFNGDGHDDLAGLNSSGDIYYTENFTTWTQIPGHLSP